MTPEQQIIEQIKQVLASVHIERGPALEELATQFAELCENANARLVKCGDFIDRGMRSEAVNEAHNLPDIFVLANQLEFEGVKKWRNLCAECDYAIPQLLNSALLDKLKNASSQEQQLAPLLREYRRFVYQGDHASCIRLLRKIRALDPGNPSWAANLRPLEEAEMDTLLAQAEKAMADNDRTRLKELFDDLDNRQRVVKPPEDIMKRMRRELLAERAVDLKREGQLLMGKIQAAIEENDGVLVEHLLASMNEVAVDDAFLDKPEGWDASISNAKDFLALLQERCEKQADFLKAVESMQNMLAGGNFTELELRHEWERLLSWNIPVSDMLKRQVQEVLDDISMRRKRKVRMIVTASSAVAALALVGVGTALFIQQKQNTKRQVISHVNQLHDSGKYDELEIYLNEINTNKPSISALPEVESIRRKLYEYKKDVAQSDVEFKSIMDKLSEIRTDEYRGTTTEQILQLLKDAELLAGKVSDESAASRVRSWRDGWKSWQERRASQANSQLKEVTVMLNTALDEQKRMPYTDLDAEAAKLDEMTQRVTDARALAPFASSEEREAFVASAERIDAWRKNFDGRKKKHGEFSRELDTLKNSIPNATTDLAAYKKLLARYVEIADAADPMVRDFNRVLENFKLYEGAVLRDNQPILEVPLSKEHVASLEKALEGEDSPCVGSIWEQDMRVALAFDKVNGIIRNKLNEVLSASPELFDLYYIEYRKIGETQWHRLYSQGKPLQSGPDPNNADAKIYWGNIYWAEAVDDIPIVTHTKNAFPDYLSTSKYEFNLPRQHEDFHCEYAKFLYRFISESADAKDMIAHVLNGVQKLYADQKMEPVMKALLIKRMLSAVNNSFVNMTTIRLGDMVPEFAEMIQTFSKVQTDVPWINARHPDVVAAATAFDTAVNDAPKPKEILDKLKCYEDVLAMALNAGVRCVGICRLNANNTLVLDLRGRQFSEIWGIFPTRTGSQPFFMVVSDDGTAIRDDVAQLCFPYMPVFAPAKGHETQAIKKQLGDKTYDFEIARPLSWPSNSWK